MAKKLISWKTKGMNRDVSVSAFNPEFAFENINLRLSTNEGNTMMSWVNEKGPKEMKLKIDTLSLGTSNADSRYTDTIAGVAIGTAILNHQLVIFTKDGEDQYDDCYIYVLKASNVDTIDFEGIVLYRGTLKFDVKHPIETLVSYESENIQKVYWTDGLNQPRVVNIANIKKYNDSSFDFVQELALDEEVSVTKIFGSGEFPAGVIQYAFTYYNKYGQESNIFYTTPLQYISYVDRGGSPDSKIANSFKIEITGIDDKFDYLRIYSILRTSKDATPFCKRVQDIEITGDTVNDRITFIDTGLLGESIDPTELLYLGGEEICAETMEQKDGTLFLGNIQTKRSPLTVKDEFLIANDVSSKISSYPLANDYVKAQTETRTFSLVSKEPFNYINTLSSPDESDYPGAVGFKGGEYYRLGIQFQYKNGKWSEPCWIGDKQQTNYPEVLDANKGTLSIPIFKYTIDNNNGELTDVFKDLYNSGYRRVRPVFAVPGSSDKTILLQGVGCPTMYRKVDRYSDAKSTNATGDSRTDPWEGKKEGKLYAQSSWLFRVPTEFKDSQLGINNGHASNGGGKICYLGKLYSQFEEPVLPPAPVTSGNSYVMSPYLRSTEVMGFYDDGHAFYVDDKFATIHSPELIFDTSFHNMDFEGLGLENVGGVLLGQTYGDIDIQTSTPAMGSDAAGYEHRSVVTDGDAALITAPYFNDYVVEGLGDNKFQAYNSKNTPSIYFPVYLWQKNGSLNNDINRDNSSALLLKKKISNYRLGLGTTYKDRQDFYKYTLEETIQLFDDDELSVVKVGGHAYMGNMETMLTPSRPSPHFLIGSPWATSSEAKYTNFLSDSEYHLALDDPFNTDSFAGIYSWKKSGNVYNWISNSNGGDDAVYRAKGLAQWRSPISMKYKSTAHLVVKLKDDSSVLSKPLTTNSIYHATNGVAVERTLPVVEVTRDYNSETIYGGTSTEALKAATWIPCGPPKSFTDKTTSLDIFFKWGDTYFQRFECLKTYPFTPEDKNQVVEIASFMVETRVNIDGRYDRNRAQTSNLNMTPQNFNLLNPVYSQMDNFFSYKMLDEDDYKNVNYPNNITWTKTKESGADVDLWTNITMANTLEMDGDKGEITKLTRLNNQLLCFQDSGISQILYNENTQISTTEGVPIEIANSEKVQGKRYLSDTVGCSNKWSMAQTPGGIYFMDSNEKSIYLFNGQLNNLSTAGGFNAWAKQHIPSAEVKWKPSDFEGDGSESFVAYYDKQNQDVLFINNDTALAYSEKFNCFTSFYDYGGSPFFENLDDVGIWIKGDKLWKHQAGEYCNFFGENKPYSMTLIANQEPQLDKIFTNVEFRACVSDEGTYDDSGKEFTPSLPFDNLEAWDEYQHGITTLNNRNKDRRLGHGMMDSLLARKFRIWRCDVPRDNATVDAATECPLGIKRFKVRPLDRIRNTWAYLKLSKDAAREGSFLSKVEVHDIVASYFA